MTRRATTTARRRNAASGVKTPDVQAKYDAAGTGRRVKGWNPASTGPNRAIQGLQKIRNRSRDTARNDWAGASGIQKWTTNLVGVGITPRWKRKLFADLWRKFVPYADADGVLDAYGLQTLGVRSWLDAGEVFLRRRPRDLTLPLPAPVQFQLLEADMVPLLDTDTWQGMPAGNTIRQGIERNKYGRRVAYWCYKTHPGDGDGKPTEGDLIRIPASEMRHIFEPKRPGQLRGVSELAPVLVRLRASMDFEDTVLDRQKLANLFTMFITRQLPEDADIDYDENTGLPKWYDKNGNPVVGLEPGISQELQPGEDVKFANPPEAGTTFSEYMRTTHLGTAAGANLPYELMSGDIKDISDRTLRVVINEFRRFARQRQWQIVIPMLCQPMVEWWADAAALAGDIALGDMLDEAKAPTWSPEGWEYIHPTQDAEGKAKLIEAGIVSRDDVIAERGDDPAEVDERRAAAKAREKKLGLEAPPKPAAGQPGAPAPAPGPQALTFDRFFAQQGEQAQKQQEREAQQSAQALRAIELVVQQGQDAAQRMHETFVAMAEKQTEAIRAIAERPINLAIQGGEVNLPAPVVNVAAPNVNVEPPTVNVAAPNVSVESPTVNVAAPVVNVTNDVDVPAPEVTVNLPPRKTETDVTRNRAGEIVHVTQVEKTIVQ